MPPAHPSPNTSPWKNQAGLTLAELMVTVAIISILAAIAVPNYFQDKPRKSLKDAAIDLRSQMQLARLNAISQNRDWRIEFDTAGNRYCLVSSGQDGTFNDTAIPACTVAGDDQMAPPIRLASYGGQVQYGFGNATSSWNGTALNPASQATSITFSRRGLATAGSVYLGTVTATGYCYSLTTSAGGGVKLRFYNGVQPFNQRHWLE